MIIVLGRESGWARTKLCYIAFAMGLDVLWMRVMLGLYKIAMRLTGTDCRLLSLLAF